MTGFIYAVRCGDRVKIGWSEKPMQRFSKIKSDSPAPCELLGIEPGSKADESELHARFAAYQAHGEWFHLRAEVAEWACRMETVRPYLSAAVACPSSHVIGEPANDGQSLVSWLDGARGRASWLAARLGIPRARVSELRAGRHNVSLVVAFKIEELTDGAVTARALAREAELRATIQTEAA